MTGSGGLDAGGTGPGGTGPGGTDPGGRHTRAFDGRRLASMALFDGVDPAELDRVGAALRPLRLAAGDVLLREGDAGDTFALLVEGRVEVTRAGPGGIELLAEPTSGAILGELAVLLGQPRTATITARAPSLAAVGSRAVLFDLLDHPVVLARLRRLASARLAHDLRALTITLTDGTTALLRPLLPEDRQGFGAALEQLSPSSRRRRFFSSTKPSAAMIEYLVDIDYVDHFAWLVVDAHYPHAGLASARYIRTDPDDDSAEVAFEVIDRLQGRGIGTLLLGAVGVAASEAGIRRLVGDVLHDNASMRAVFAKVGGQSSFAEQGVLQVTMDPVVAAGLLDAGLRRQLAAATHDIVTAASLALMTTA